MKGNNVIEGYCHVCGGPVSQRHINCKYAVREEGRLVHIHHLEENKKLLTTPKLLDTLAELLKSRQDGMTAHDLAVIARKLTSEAGIDFAIFEKALTVFMCHVECKDPWKGFEWLKKLKTKDNTMFQGEDFEKRYSSGDLTQEEMDAA